MKTGIVCFCAFAITAALTAAQAQVPQMITYQGRVIVGGTNFSGTGQFKFALVNGAGGVSYWSNDGSSSGGSQPTLAVPVTANKGTYAVLLGDTTLANMTLAIPAAVFTNTDVRLRVWFSDGLSAFQQLSPDQRLAAVGYAMLAANVADAAITVNKIAAGAVGSAQLAANLTVSGTLAAGSFQGNGAGLTNLSGSGFAWQTVAGASQQAAANTGYIVTNSTNQVTITLPAAPTVGDIVRVSSLSAGGWRIAQNSGQSVLGGNAVLLSVGVTWKACDTNRAWYCVASSADGCKLVAVVNPGQIYTSTDSGGTWMPRADSRSWYCVASSADGNRLVAAVWGGYIWTSSDAGVTWTSHAGAGSRNWGSVASSADGSKLFAVDYGTSGNIYYSTDSGATWNPTTSSFYQGQCLASSADGSKILLAENGSRLAGSTSSGGSWGFVGDDTRSWVSVVLSADGSKLVAVEYGGQIYTSTDTTGLGTWGNEGTWTARDSNRNWSTVASSADGCKLVAVVWGGQIYTSTDSGVTWTPRASSRNWHSVASSADGSKLVAVDNGGYIYTSASVFGTPGTTTTVGTGGFLTGGQNTAIELQYIGNNQFLPISYVGSIFGY